MRKIQQETKEKEHNMQRVELGDEMAQQGGRCREGMCEG